MPESQPKRRNFQFGLPSVFVAVTLFGVWLGWQREMKFIRARADFIAQNENQWSVTETEAKYYGPNDIYVKYLHLPGPVSIPIIRRWLGDGAIVAICVSNDRGHPGMTVDDVRRLFPEAWVVDDPQEFTRIVAEEDSLPYKR